MEGTYVLLLEVCDPSGACDSDSVSIEATAVVNTPPVCDAGPDQEVTLGDVITLDATGTSDADGDSLAFFWAISRSPAGSATTIAAGVRSTALRGGKSR